MNTNLLPSLRWIFSCILLSVPALGVAASDTGSAWYLQAAISAVNSSANVSNFTIDDKKTGWSLGLGYAFNRYLSIQAGYHNLGENHSATDCPGPRECFVNNMDRVDFEGLSLSVQVSWPVTETVEVFGKLGVIGWDTHFQNFNRDKSGEDLLYGVGVGVNLTPHWRSSLQYERFDLDVSSTSLGLSYNF